MSRHKWNGTNICEVCGLEKYVYKEPLPNGGNKWKVYYHLNGEIVENKGCIKTTKKSNTYGQLEMFNVLIS